MAINICIYHVGLNTKSGNNSGQYIIVSVACHLNVVLIGDIYIANAPLTIH
jgi:hypothetical protein